MNKIILVAVLALAGISFSACSGGNGGGEEDGDAFPFVGYWQFLDEEGEYDSRLHFTQDGAFQEAFQDGVKTEIKKGRATYDKQSKTLILYSSSDNEITEKQVYTVREFTNSRLKLLNADGMIFDYKATTSYLPPQHDDWGKSLTGGTWNIYIRELSNDILDVRRYTFYEGGTYSYWSEQYREYMDGTYTYIGNVLILDGKSASMQMLTSNTIKFVLDGEIYSGERSVKKDKQLVKTNKKYLVGTWLCIVDDYHGDDSAQLTLKADGEYIIKYLDEYEDTFMGTYYVSEDKIFFEEASGKDPIGGEHQIEKLTSKEFILSELFDGLKIRGKNETVQGRK